MAYSRFAVRAAGVILAAFAWLPAQAEKGPAIESFILHNGMPVVLISSPRVPAVTHMIWYKVGAADDFPGRSGLAHYNEHMMFQGTPTYGKGAFAKAVSTHGGHYNAFTGRDYTGYYVSIAKEHLPMVMQMEADRMLNLAPSQDNFLRERDVIIEERRMSIDNRPESLMNEQLQAALFRNHPYHTPIIGWMQEMQALSRDDVLAFHSQFYHPANAVLVVAGDITRAELQPMAETYYGSLPTGEKYMRHWRMEPPQRGARTFTMTHENVREPQLVRIYQAASIGGLDKALVVPSFVMAQVMGGGISSRLYQSLVVRQKLASSVSVDYSGLSVGPGECEVAAIPAQGVTLAVLEAALDKEILSLKETPVSEQELDRAKTQLKADTIYGRDGLESIASTLGGLVAVGLSPDYFARWPDMISEVSASDIRKAAQATFQPEQSVTGYLLPRQDKAEGGK